MVRVLERISKTHTHKGLDYAGTNPDEKVRAVVCGRQMFVIFAATDCRVTLRRCTSTGAASDAATHVLWQVCCASVCATWLGCSRLLPPSSCSHDGPQFLKKNGELAAEARSEKAVEEGLQSSAGVGVGHLHAYWS